MAVTLREVADKAGVSIAAVSKVLHGRGSTIRVGHDRAEMIRNVASTMGYYPNAIARSLRSSKTQTIGLIFEHFGDFVSGPLYYVELLGGVSSVVFPKHYRISLVGELMEDVVGCLADGRLDGIIWCKLAHDEETERAIANCPIPIVALNAPAPADPKNAVYVACDNEAGIGLAVDHLVSLGHRRILFLSEQEESAPDKIARTNGFLAALERHGISPQPEDVAQWGWNFDHFGSWWASKPPHSAIICWSERAGGTLLKQAIRHGVKVPEELSVVGFDSTDFCETTKPRMTAVRQPVFAMAQQAARILIDILEGERPSQFSYTFPCTFDERDSTAQPLNGEEKIHES